jgi:hypothetical protein
LQGFDNGFEAVDLLRQRYNIGLELADGVTSVHEVAFKVAYVT